VEFSQHGKNGALEKHRARILAKGHLQKKDIDDYFESLHLFSARMTTMQCVRSSAPRAYYLLCKRVYTEIGLTQFKSDECCFILVKNNVKNGHKIPENFEAFLC
jgi:hypothetical protein